jgi:hypothetical protein
METYRDELLQQQRLLMQHKNLPGNIQAQSDLSSYDSCILPIKTFLTWSMNIKEMSEEKNLQQSQKPGDQNPEEIHNSETKNCRQETRNMETHAHELPKLPAKDRNIIRLNFSCCSWRCSADFLANISGRVLWKSIVKENI